MGAKLDQWQIAAQLLWGHALTPLERWQNAEQAIKRIVDGARPAKWEPTMLQQLARDVPRSGPYGKTVPMLWHLARHPGADKVIMEMLDAGMSPDHAVGGVPVLFYAVTHDTTNLVKLLIDRGASLDVTCSASALHQAMILRSDPNFDIKGQDHSVQPVDLARTMFCKEAERAIAAELTRRHIMQGKTASDNNAATKILGPDSFDSVFDGSDPFEVKPAPPYELWKAAMAALEPKLDREGAVRDYPDQWSHDMVSRHLRAGAAPLDPATEWEQLFSKTVLKDVHEKPTLHHPLIFSLLFHESRNCKEWLKSALDGGMSPNATFGGWPLLHAVVAQNDPDLTEIVLGAGADPTVVCDSSMTIHSGLRCLRKAQGMTALQLAQDYDRDQVSGLIQAALARKAVDRVLSGLPRAAP